MPDSSNTRVLLADDHAIFRHGLSAMLGATPGLEVVGEAATGEEAVQKVEELHPDLVVMDVKMPGMGGIEATRRILASRPQTAVVVLTMFEDDDSVLAAMRAGARGYAFKNTDEDEVLRVIRAVAEGEAHFGPKIAERLMGFFDSPEPARATSTAPELTAREREVLGLLASGKTNKEIAEKLVLSVGTVERHVTNLYAKIGARGRAEATAYAFAHGIVEPLAPS